MKKRDGVRRCTRCQVSRLSGFICKHTGQQERFLSIPLLALSSSWCFFRRWYVSSNNVSFFSKKKEEEEKLYLLFFTRQYRPRVVLFNFFFTTVDSCRTDSRTHIRSNALMLGSSLSSSLSGEDRGARVACCCPRGLRNSSPDADLLGEVATVEKRSPPIGRLVIRRSVSTVHDLSRFTHIFAGAGRRRRRQQHRYTGSCIKTRAALRIMIHCAGHESYKL